MAQPIRKTPTLTGKDADRFISKMVKTVKRAINEAEKQILLLIKE